MTEASVGQNPGDVPEGEADRRAFVPLLWGLRIGTIAFAVSVGLSLARTLGLGLGFDVIDLALAFAPTIIVPLGLDLVRHGGRGEVLLGVISPFAGAAAALAVGLGVGGVTPLLAGLWVGAALGIAVVGFLAWLGGPKTRWSIAELSRVAAGGYLAVGSVWLLLSTLQLTPFGLSADLVRLTAVHFHYAGFAAALIAGRTASVSSHLFASPSAALVIAAPPVIAAGFTMSAVLLPLGASLMAAGLLGTAHVLFWDQRPKLYWRTAAGLLTVAALAVVVPMVLAVQWAVGAVWDTPALSIPVMAQTHGMLNAFGFSLFGLVGWRLAGRWPRPE